jgi:hypothetical protein
MANQMNTIANLAMALALLLGSVAANSQSVTFDFTGRVADATYADAPTAVLIPDGTLVMGSFTFTYDPLISGDGTVSGTIGSSSPQGWLATMPEVEPGFDLFSSTVQVVGFSTSYRSGNTGIGSSQIGGGSTTGLPTNPCGGFSGFGQPSGSLNGCEMSGAGSVGTDSWVILVPKPGTVDFLSNGLPNISNIDFGSGEFVYYTRGPTSDIFGGGASGVQYEITSMSLAVPEIDSASAASGLTLLLGGLLVLRGRRPMKLDSTAV